MKFFCILLLTLQLILATVVTASDYQVEDIYIPSDCEKITKAGDHLLLEYAISFFDGTNGASLKRPAQLYHLTLSATDEFPIFATLKGMCKNSVRRMKWEDGSLVNLLPLFVKDSIVDIADREKGLIIDLTVAQITTADEYQIFSSLREGNMSHVLDLIEQHVGVNAVDEWGQTPLMIAVQMNRVDVVAALLNTRMPKVEINARKSSGYTALFYAVEKSTPSIVSALLRRGADPNYTTLQEGSKGNTPLHFACLLEKTKPAELLLEFGANPFAQNQFGMTPLQLVPQDAVRSTKLFFKKMFEDAQNRIKNLEAAEKKDSILQAVMSGKNEL